MNNNTIVLECYNEDSVRIDISCYLTMPKNNVSTAMMDTDHTTLIINSGDSVYNNTLPLLKNDVVIVNGNYNNISFKKMYTLYDDTFNKFKLTVKDNVVITTNATVAKNIDKSYFVNPNVQSSEGLSYIEYKIYYVGEIAKELLTPVDGVILLSTLRKTNSGGIIVNFLKSGIYNITCTAVNDINDVSVTETKQIIVDGDLLSGIFDNALNNTKYFEWE